MKKYFGYLVVIALGVLVIVALINRSETIDKCASNGTNTVVLFAKN